MQRPRYFDGQLLTQAELNSAQAYVMAKNRLHNRYLHGWGVVCGLRVSCCDDTHVNVEAGYALDPCGNDIVVPQAQTIPLVQMIQSCRNQSRPSTECNPFASSTSIDCAGADQTWCLTISYTEQDSRPVAALTGAYSSGSGGSGASGCGCGCGSSNGNGNGKASSSAASSVSPMDTVGRPATACEPTRTTETASFGVVCMPAQSTDSGDTTATRRSVLTAAQQTLAQRLPAGTLIGQTLAPEARLMMITEQAPQPAGDLAQEEYTLVCRWLSALQSELAAVPLTDCTIAKRFAAISVRQPTDGEDPTEYGQSVLRPAIDTAQSLVSAVVVDLLCWNLIPGCTPPPASNCLVLACVTLRDDVIVDICMGAPRRQVVSFPALQYWISDMPSDWVNQLPTFLSPTDFGTAVSELCCAAGRRDKQAVPSSAAAARFYALADVSTGAPPAQDVTGISPDEYAALRSGATELRTVAVNAFKQLQQ